MRFREKRFMFHRSVWLVSPVAHSLSTRSILQYIRNQFHATPRTTLWFISAQGGPGEGAVAGSLGLGWWFFWHPLRREWCSNRLKGPSLCLDPQAQFHKRADDHHAGSQ